MVRNRPSASLMSHHCTPRSKDQEVLSWVGSHEHTGLYIT